MRCSINRSHLTLALCVVALVGCTDTRDRASQKTASMPALALVNDVCSLCHGLTGESVSPLFPKLAGQQKDYLKQQLTDLKPYAHG